MMVNVFEPKKNELRDQLRPLQNTLILNL
jgi:hypothetical protein